MDSLYFLGRTPEGFTFDGWSASIKSINPSVNSVYLLISDPRFVLWVGYIVSGVIERNFSNILLSALNHYLFTTISKFKSKNRQNSLFNEFQKQNFNMIPL